jgi:hypothetical protein
MPNKASERDQMLVRSSSSQSKNSGVKYVKIMQAPVASVNVMPHHTSRKAVGRTSANHAFDRLERHFLQVVDALLGSSVDHGELARDLVASDWVIRDDAGGIRHDVEVRERGLDHEEVGSFVGVAFLQGDQYFAYTRDMVRMVGEMDGHTMALRARTRALGGSW